MHNLPAIEYVIFRILRLFRKLPVNPLMIGSRKTIFLDFFKGFDKVEAVRGIFGEKTSEVLRHLRVAARRATGDDRGGTQAWRGRPQTMATVHRDRAGSTRRSLAGHWRTGAGPSGSVRGGQPGRASLLLVLHRRHAEEEYAWRERQREC